MSEVRVSKMLETQALCFQIPTNRVSCESLPGDSGQSRCSATAPTAGQDCKTTWRASKHQKSLAEPGIACGEHSMAYRHTPL